MSLPSREEFIKTNEGVIDEMKEMWNKSLFRCPICNGEVKRDYSAVFMSNPPKYRYFCKSSNCMYEEVL